MEKIVFLMGFMGAGKTTLGKKLASRLNVKFLDTDQLIEAKYNISISDYFEEHGEDQFRLEEKRILEEILKNNRAAIVSVGGGLPCFLDNLEVMNESGITIYLHRPAKELFQRLKQGKSKRPLIANMNDKELLDFVENTLGEREKYYRQAKFVVDRNRQNPSDLVNLINE